MNIQQLSALANHHQDLADAYNRGVQAVHEARKETIKDCIHAILREEVMPGTCAHPAKRLSPQTKERNRIAKQIAESVAIRLRKHLQGPDDDMPF
jgi:hypothetical protein